MAKAISEELARTKICCCRLNTPDEVKMIAENWSLYFVSKCVASDCMAWRWFSPYHDEGGESDGGFCGIAGAWTTSQSHSHNGSNTDN